MNPFCFPGHSIFIIYIPNMVFMHVKKNLAKILTHPFFIRPLPILRVNKLKKERGGRKLHRKMSSVIEVKSNNTDFFAYCIADIRP